MSVKGTRFQKEVRKTLPTLLQYNIWRAIKRP